MPRSSRRQSPDLSDALLNLGTVIQLLTQFSMDSMLALLPENAQKDSVLMQHYRDLVKLCGPLNIGNEHLNARWNKSYGAGGTDWEGPAPDGLDRGGMPYFCPGGWARISLNVCEDKEFRKRYHGWGYLYHGTKSKFVGSILTSGLRGSRGMYCGSGDTAVYFSPSIEYCSHLRYASVEFNPQTRKYLQIVLQCRVNPAVIWKQEEETLSCRRFGVNPDDNFALSELTVLVKPNSHCSKTGHCIIRDGVVCTGIMVRMTDKHPLELDNWWANSPEYVRKWKFVEEKVEPQQGQHNLTHIVFDWKGYSNVQFHRFRMSGSPLNNSFRVINEGSEVYPRARLSRQPFAKGSMRFAYFLYTRKGMFVLKKYNQESKEHIKERLKISVEQAAMRDVNTHLVAQYYAEQHNKITQNTYGKKASNWHIEFLDPYLITIRGEVFFGEKFMKGGFMKWNDNNGNCNLTADAVKNNMDRVAASFSHFTFCASGGKLAVVDLQGWDENSKITFTDPQIHTHSLTSTDCPLKGRFSMGNHGKTGIFRFFANHTCGRACRELGLKHPHQNLR